MKQVGITAALALTLAAFPLTSLVLPALAQDETVTITITPAFAATVAAAAEIPLEDVPASIEVSVADAVLICGASVEAGGTCEGTDASALLPYLEDDDSSESSESSMSSMSSVESSSSEEASDNSAKAFAPGQLKEDGESAKAYAPGQTKGDGESARENAPGQQKKNGN